MNIYVKINDHSYRATDLAQISPKNVTTCILTPYDTDNLDKIQKSLINQDFGFHITLSDKSITITQPSSALKEIKEKMLQKAKKLVVDKKEKLHKTRQSIKE
jgi:ribosome recycling factor